MRNDWVRCGVSCDRCHKDEWFPFQGFNRCECGQELWVEREKDANGGIRFPYRQGPQLPAGQGGWMRTTD